MTDNKETKQGPAVEAEARDERAAFEAWARKKGLSTKPHGSAVIYNHERVYKNDSTQAAWEAWQESAALARAQTKNQ